MEEAASAPAAVPARPAFTFNRAPGTPPVVALDPALAPQKRGRKPGQGAFKADAVGEDSEAELYAEGEEKAREAVKQWQEQQNRAIPVMGTRPQAYQEAFDTARAIKQEEAVINAFWLGFGGALVLVGGIAVTYYILHPHLASKTVTAPAAAAVKYGVPTRVPHPL
jgi:hypothetical protein